VELSQPRHPTEVVEARRSSTMNLMKIN